MKERPILMSAPMVRAILAGTKTQTRRIIKPIGHDEGFVLLDHSKGWWPYRSDDGDSTFHTVKRGGNLYQDETPHRCPYGLPGDRMWVREHCELTTDDCDPGCMSVRYLADGEVRDVGTEMPDSCPGLVDWINGRWSRPSIHMPKWASRSTLEIVGVRVERLQDISEADAIAEGISRQNVIVGAHYANGHVEECADRFFFDGCDDEGFEDSVEAYAELWESINGPGSWDANPWVWIIEFKRVAA